MSFAIDIEREEIRRGGLMAFIRAFWSLVEAAPLSEERHMPIIARHLEAIAVRGMSSLKHDHQPWMDNLNPIQDLVIAVPPGTSKSLTVSVFYPAWLWSMCPSLKLITTSYSEMLVTRDAKRSFELMQTEKYRTMFPDLEIVGGERASMQNYWNTHKGMRLAVQLSGSVLGAHAHILIVDDYLKSQDLLGNAADALQKVIDKWDGTLSSRSAHAPTFSRVVCAQRLAYGDLSGVMIRRGAQHLCLPMEHDVDRHYESEWGSDWRTEPGELLAPIRFPQEVIDFRKSFLSQADYAGQYQQNPVMNDGAKFERGWFDNRYNGTPWGNARIHIYVDPSNSDKKGSDYTVIQAWAKQGPKYWLVDQVRARMGFTEQLAQIKNLRRKFANPGAVVVEARAVGPALVDALKRQISGVRDIHPIGSKDQRIEAIEYLLRAGDVSFPNATWMNAFIDECCQFPLGMFDDQPDCMAMALTDLSAKDRRHNMKEAMEVVRKSSAPGYSWQRRPLF